MANATAEPVKKVGGAKKGAKADAKEKKEKLQFDPKGAVNEAGESIVDGDGKLTSVPVAIEGKYEGWSEKLHKPLTRGDFAGDAPFLDYKVHTLDIRLVKLTKQRDDLKAKAQRLRQFGDEKTRKKAARLQRMREQMAALEAELSADGVELDEV